MKRLAFLLALLLTSPAAAQVITTGAPTAGSGGGSGNVTGTFTTGVVPMGTAAHTLSDSLNAVVVGTNGSIGFNNAHYAEIVTDGASLANSGVFGGLKSQLTLHGTTDFAEFGITFWNDADGQSNFVALTGGSGFFEIDFGGTSISTLSIGPTLLALLTGNFVWGGALTTFGDAGTNNAFFNLSGSSIQLTGFNNSFLVSQDSTPAGLAIAVTPNAVTQIQQTNTTHTALITASTILTSTAAAATPNAAQGIMSLDAGDATGNVFWHLSSPQVTANGGGRGSVVLDSSLSAGSKPYMIFQADSTHSVALSAPSTTATGFEAYVLPAAKPAANGQPLVSTTAGVMSFAAGVTKTCTVLPTVVGGIITAC